jgi:hypothetical protein
MSVHVGFVVDKVALVQVSLSVPPHRPSVFTHVSSVGWIMGPLAAQFHRNIVSFHRNNKLIPWGRVLLEELIVNSTNQ